MYNILLSLIAGQVICCITSLSASYTAYNLSAIFSRDVQEKQLAWRRIISNTPIWNPCRCAQNRMRLLRSTIKEVLVITSLLNMTILADQLYRKGLFAQHAPLRLRSRLLSRALHYKRQLSIISADSAF